MTFNSTKSYTVLGHFFFAFSALLAIYFMVERTTVIDTSYYLCNIINNEGFFFGIGRIGAFPTQLIPILLAKLGAPITWIGYSYSLSFIALYWIIFYLCVNVFKSLESGVTIVLSMFLLSGLTFYHPVTESHQALVWCCLYFALIFGKNKKINQLKPVFRFGIALVIILFAFFNHPASVFPLLFAPVFKIISDKKYTWSENWLLILSVVVIYSLKFVLTDSSGYEGGFFSQLTQPKLILELFSNYPAAYLYKFFYGYYWIPLFLYFIIAINYINKSEWLKLSFVTATFVGFMVITNIAYAQGDSDMMMERNYLPLTVLLGFPFMKDVVLSSKNFQFVKFSLIIFLLLFSTARILYKSKSITARVNYLTDKMVTKSIEVNSHKLLVDKGEWDENMVGASWAVAFETMLLSSYNDSIELTTVYVNQKENAYDFDLNNTTLILGPHFWPNWNVTMFNKRYFDFKPEAYKTVIFNK
jgi:hypothetical protein